MIGAAPLTVSALPAAAQCFENGDLVRRENVGGGSQRGIGRDETAFGVEHIEEVERTGLVIQLGQLERAGMLLASLLQRAMPVPFGAIERERLLGFLQSVQYAG